MSERFHKLLAVLDRAGLEPMPVEFAEMLWLAAHISPTSRPVSANLTKPESPAFEKLTPPPEPEPLDDQTAQDSPSTPHREPPQPDQAALYPSSPTAGGRLSARPIRSPAVPSLPNALGLGRALRPLNRKIASRTRYCLNEEATAERLAEQGIAGPTLWIPALEPARERWFELALVIDRGDSMRVWQPVLADLRRLLGYHGAFRTVRIWHLETNSGKAVLRVGADPDYARLCKPQELKAWAGRRLVLVVSDCISRAWHTGSVGELLKPLCAAAPLAVLQMLPQRMWRGTSLGRGTETRLSAAEPGAVAARLPVADINRLGFEGLETSPKSWRLPVLTLEADVLLAWADLLNGQQNTWIYAVYFDTQTRYAVGDSPPQTTPTAEGIAKRLDRFFADASPQAQELASYLAAAPLTLPVMRLVQHVMLPQSGQTELAEIFVSGLLRKQGDSGKGDALYDFHEGVRERLLEAVGNSEAVEVLRLVSDFVNSRTGRAVNFHALLADPTADGNFALDGDARYFAKVGAKVLRRLGGEYLRLAVRLEGKLPVNPKSQSVFLTPTGTLEDRTDSQNVNEGVENVACQVGENLALQIQSNIKMIPGWDIKTQGSPYVGLRAMTYEHSGLFFGRDPQLKQLATKLANQRFVAVVGASGTGKSSLVWAGLLPKLKEWQVGGISQWVWVRITPMEYSNFIPDQMVDDVLTVTFDRRISVFKLALQERGAKLYALLNEILPAGNEQLLLFVDQFEELFSLVASSSRKLFIHALDDLMASGKARVVVTMRANFLNQCMESEGFGERLADWFNHGLLLLSPPGADALREIVEGPARLAGLSFEAGLVDKIVEDIGLKPGNLALMAFALEKLFQQRYDSVISWQAYRELGGFEGAIAEKAETVFAALGGRIGHDPKYLMARVFSELVDIDEYSGVASRRKAPLALWDQASTVYRLIEDFVDARLLLIDGGFEPTLEIAHETLLRNWHLLSAWIAARKDQFLMRKRLQRDTAEWVRHGGSGAFLWRDLSALESGNMIGDLLYTPTDSELSFLGPVHKKDMLRLILDADTTHKMRATVGIRLSLIGDDRPGVGVIDGLPDIVWCHVLAGRVNLSGDEGSFDVDKCWLSKYPITKLQYMLFIDADDGYINPDWWQDLPKLSYLDADRQVLSYGNYPAVNVTWIEAVAYCRWLSQRLGFMVRLPTEWEWQQAACQGDQKNVYPWGLNWDSRRCNSHESQLNRVISVGMYAQDFAEDNPLDMAGNVWEWCLNRYVKPVPLSSIVLADISERTVRGGSWLNLTDTFRCSSRGGLNPSLRFNYIGFRLIRVSP